MFNGLGKTGLKIRGRIIIGIGIVIGVFGIQSMVSNIGFEQTSDSLREYGKTNESTIAILEIERNALELQRSVLAFTYSGYSGMVKRVIRIQDSLKTQLNSVDAVITDDKRKDILKRMKNHFISYNTNFEAAVEELNRREQLIHSEMNELGKKISLLLSQMLEKKLQQNSLKTAALAGAAQEKILLAHRDAQNFIITPDSLLEKGTKAKLILFKEHLSELKKYSNDAESQKSLNEIQQLLPKYEASFLGMVQATRAYMHLVYVVMAGEAAEISHLSKELIEYTLQDRKVVETQFN